MKKPWWAPILVLALSIPASSRAAPPETDPLQIYNVTPQAGAWMILASSYSGDEGKELARQLVLDLRSKHHLPAYVWNLSAEQRRRQEEADRAQRAQTGAPARPGGVRFKDEWAVLIGGYADINAASAALPTIRKLPLPDLHLPGDRLPFDSEFYTEQTGEIKRAVISPYAKAMCVPNPTVRRDQKKKFDPFWTTLNEYESYSLLKCRKRWTFAVKEYAGASMVQSKATTGGLFDGLAWLGGKQTGEILDAAGQQAHNLATTLEQCNFEAHVFHTRYSSIVTIGNFDDPNDPQAERVKQQYRTFQQQAAASMASRGIKDPMQLFRSPLPMEVPHP
jgi:hypothetical protein